MDEIRGERRILNESYINTVREKSALSTMKFATCVLLLAIRGDSIIINEKLHQLHKRISKRL